MSTLALLLALSASAAEPRLSVHARALQQGEIALVAVEGHDVKSPPHATFQGRELSFFPAASSGTWLALIGLDLDAAPGPAALKASLKDARGRVYRSSQTLVIEPGRFPEQQLAVEQKYVTPPKSDAERAESEAAKLHGLFLHGEEKRLFDSRFDAPIPGAASARFGERRVFNGQPRAPHSGMDLRAKSGTPIKAPAAGRVVLAGPLFFSGNTVVLDHGLGVTTLYAHLSRIDVKPGDMVAKGQRLGLVGATGRVTGPHLHWGLKLKAARIDPYSLAALDLDAWLKPRKVDPLVKSAACAATDLPAAPAWGKTEGGLRLRARPLKPYYLPGESVGLLVEINNAGWRSAFLDFVRDPALRPVVIGLNGPPQPYSALPSSATARLATEQLKIPAKKSLCFEVDADARGPLLARETTGYALVYSTEFLYSTSTVRSGVWKGRLSAPPFTVEVSTP